MTNAALRSRVLDALAVQPMTSTEIAIALGSYARRVAEICVSMERERIVSRAGLTIAPNNYRVPLWCLPGAEKSGDARTIGQKRQPARAPSLEPVSVTALLCGDPLPGRSAYDMRQAAKP